MTITVHYQFAMKIAVIYVLSIKIGGIEGTYQEEQTLTTTMILKIDSLVATRHKIRLLLLLI